MVATTGLEYLGQSVQILDWLVQTSGLIGGLSGAQAALLSATLPMTETVRTALPEWLQSPQAIGMLMAAVAAVMYAGFAMLSYRQRRRQRLLEDMVKQRTQELEEKSQQLAEALAAAKRASRTDRLTGLANRRAVEEGLPADVLIVDRRFAERPYPADSDFTMFVLDIDHFKAVNDQYGHAVGDRILEQFSTILKDVFRASDIIARWGGEEFLVVSRFTDRANAAEIAERLRHCIETHDFVIADGETTRCTASIGYASYPFDPDFAHPLTWECTIGIADCALYAAKKTSRNAWVGLSAGSPGTPLTKADIIRDTSALIARGALRAETSIADDKDLIW